MTFYKTMTNIRHNIKEANLGRRKDMKYLVDSNIVPIFALLNRVTSHGFK